MMDGINIWSGERGLGGALTNPTTLTARKGNLDRSWSATPEAGYPVTFRDRKFADAEAAYQAHKTQTDADLDLMTEVLVAKLRQHPPLADEITRRGGVAFLEACTHFLGRLHAPGQSGYARRSGWKWTGRGRSSMMVDCLIRAYASLQARSVAVTEAVERTRQLAQEIVDTDPAALEAVFATHPVLRKRLLAVIENAVQTL